MRVIAVDPGKATGIALWTGESGDKSIPFAHTYQLQHSLCSWVDIVLQQQVSETHVVCEAYTITGATLKKTRQNYSLEIIGALRYLAWKFEATFALQTPADAKRLSTNDRLAALGWLRRPLAAEDHANDALRHLLLYRAVTLGETDLVMARQKFSKDDGGRHSQAV
jgi:hypothetical protein